MFNSLAKSLACVALASLPMAMVSADDAAPADDAPPAVVQGWSASAASRLAALAVLQTFNADLLSHDSATQTLQEWCAAHRLATPAAIVAERVSGALKPPTATQRQELGVTPGEAVRYRRVRLHCGALVLSEADNWYVPGRLTREMNAQLDGSDVPFGRVVRALDFRRHTLSARLLWQPLPDGWDMGALEPGNPGGRQGAHVPWAVLEHRAVLTLPDGTPFSEVVETYTANVLAFAVPRP